MTGGSSRAARFGAGVALAALAAAAGCAPKTRYVAPTAATTPAFKENANWKPASPRDAEIRGAWWEMFHDEELNALEAQIDAGNQDIKTAEARFAQARAAVHGTRSGLYPQIGLGPSVVAAQPSGNRPTTAFSSTYADFLVPGSVSYEPDFWHRIHGEVSASQSAAQASAGDVETARLGIRAELALDYFTIRGLDREKDLLESAVAAYQRALELTENRFRGGIASQADVAQAQTQLETTRAQAVDLGVDRSSLEHAVAVLLGRPAAAFSLRVAPLAATPPDVPSGVPSDLLERRPDIAAAERRVAAANSQVGVATAGYYPILTLGAANGFESGSLVSWLASASNFWTIGPAALVTVFDAGRRRANTEQARAAYEQTAAAYRETVLVAFREVEDQLAALRILEGEAHIQDDAVAAAQRSLTLATNRYRGGVVSYLEVITAQNAALANQRVAVNLLTRRMNASVLLLKALGGGWSATSIRPAVSNTRNAER